MCRTIQCSWKRHRFAAFRRPCLILLIVCLLSVPVIAQDVAPNAPPSENAFDLQVNPSIEALRNELGEMLQERLGAGPKRQGLWRRGLDGRAQELASVLRKRILERFQENIERDLGAVSPLLTEPVMLEALDARGKVVEVPLRVWARPLRTLTVPEHRARAFNLLDEDELALTLYDALPESVSPVAEEGFRRIYWGDAAQALAAEARLVVSLKGGEWRKPAGSSPVANAIAVRGLDLDKGLHPNGNQTYDDTMYVIVDAGGQNTEVYEYRMTTESSSKERGVGRLDSMQVIYVRGLHRGKDPGYRLKGDSAEGTREGIEGTQRIMGANIHSAYAKREIKSDTPLSPNVSLGCQVIAASKQAFEKDMVDVLDGKGVTEFPYTIVDGEELEVLNDALRARDKHSLIVLGIPRKIEAPEKS